MIPESLKSGIILRLFKRKEAKANNKDNYRGLTLVPTLCKMYEMILLNRLENFADHCTEASFTILETINHMPERGSKLFSCFLDFRKKSL